MRKFFLVLGIFAAFAGFGQLTFGGSDTYSLRNVPTFTLNQAILTALQRNPDILRAEQEIKRAKGVIIEIRAQVLPHITAAANFEWTDPNLIGARILGTETTPPGTGGFASIVDSPPSQIRDAVPLARPSPTPNLFIEQSDISYAISVTGTQLIFNGTSWPSIRGTFFQRDSAYFAFRNILDLVIATVKTQFYQVVVNKALIDVQEQSVHLLESQLKDQQNRFEAGTVPRFNVLQAEVALYNQIPQLITAQNNYRVSKLILAKTMGLDFDPRRGENPPLEVVGEMPYIQRHIALVDAIELGKQRRAFLKQARANVLNQKEQVRAAAGQYLPTITTAKITYDDDVRQVELEIQQAYSNLQQNRELIQSQEKNVEQADEALRLAKARLDAGAGTQLDVLNAQVQLLTAQSTRLQALFGYNSSLAEFDRATGAQSTYSESFANLTPRATKTKTYYTGSGVDAEGKRKQADDSAVRVPARRSRTLFSK
jgi:outer membrane protein TolC